VNLHTMTGAPGPLPRAPACLGGEMLHRGAICKDYCSVRAATHACVERLRAETPCRLVETGVFRLTRPMRRIKEVLDGPPQSGRWSGRWLCWGAGAI